MAHHATLTTRHTPPTPRRLVPTLLAWFATHARDLPWRRTRDPYAIWVSEIMLQQTQVKTVIPYWERWMRELPTVAALAKASPTKIHKLWEGLGYYTRVRNMQNAAQQICAADGRFPKDFEAILALPGIGRYTAGAIASIAFNQPAPILDGNVIRVLTRLHGIATDPRDKPTNAHLWQLAEELVTHAKIATARIASRPSRPLREDNSCSFLNQSLMELGALVCTPRSPDCSACPVAKHCVARHEDRIAEFPHPKQRAASTARRFVALVIESEGRFLVQQRGADVVNAHYWEFPNCEVNGSSSTQTAAKQLLGAKPASLKKLCAIKHSITRYRITTEAFLARLNQPPENALKHCRAVSPAELKEIPLTAAHRRIAGKITL
jgi:A/G-specific adenine glycosylase